MPERPLSFVGAPLFTACLMLCAAPAQAAPVFFDNRAAFDLAAGPLAGFEDFEDANTDTATSQSEPGPWNSATDDTVFDPGDIPAGVTFASVLDTRLAAVDGDFSPGSTGNAIGPNNFLDDFDIIFAPGVNAAGFDHFEAVGALDGMVISLFDTDDVLITTTDVPTSFLNASFFGVIDDMNLIGRINLSMNNPGGAELIDNVAFGLAQRIDIPEPGSALLLIPGLAAWAYGRRRRNRRR